MGGEPPYKRELWSCIFTSHISESETFHTRTLGHQSSLKDGYHLIPGREPPYKREPWSCILYHSLFRKQNLSSSYSWPPIIVKRRGSFHLWEGNPLKNGNPEVVYFTIHFSESETFHPRTVCHQSLLKDVYHFIHGRGTPLKTETLKLYIYHR